MPSVGQDSCTILLLLLFRLFVAVLFVFFFFVGAGKWEELEGGIFYCRNLNLDTRLFLNACLYFFSFHTVVLLLCQNNI